MKYGDVVRLDDTHAHRDWRFMLVVQVDRDVYGSAFRLARAGDWRAIPLIYMDITPEPYVYLRPGIILLAED